MILLILAAITATSSVVCGILAVKHLKKYERNIKTQRN